MRLHDFLPEIYKDGETEKFWDILQTAVDELELSAEEVKNLLDIDKAKEDWLVNIASNLGIDLSKDFPLSNRGRISKAIDLYKVLGTKEGLKLIITLLGLECQITEWFEYNGNPYYFKVNLNNIESEELYQKLINLINEYKNERSWLELIGISSKSEGKTYVTTFTNRGKNYQIGIHFDIPNQTARLNAAAVISAGRKHSIGVNVPNINVANSNTYTAGHIKTARIHTIYPS